MSIMSLPFRFFLSASSKLVRCRSHTLQTLTRQISKVASPNIRCLAPIRTNDLLRPHRRCLQTEVDKELSKFLEKEISFEESAASKPQMQVKGVEGFEVSTEDADVTLTRKTGNEKVVVKFSINASVDSEGPLAEGENEADMVSRPPFTVEVTKGEGKTLSLQCVFVPPEEGDHEAGPQDAEAIVDSFEIEEVALHSGEWKETVYSVSADIMDGNLYDLLMDMLDERGINEEFVNHMVEYSTSYEHSRYLGFLKDLKTFVEK